MDMTRICPVVPSVPFVATEPMTSARFVAIGSRAQFATNGSAIVIRQSTVEVHVVPKDASLLVRQKSEPRYE